MRQNVRVKYAWLAAACCVVLAAGVALFSFGAARAGGAVEYSVNGAGLTYGSASDAVSLDSEPDLIKVIATNERVGYVHKDQFHAALKPASCPEEALAMMSEKHAKQKAAFMASLNDQTATTRAMPQVKSGALYDEILESASWQEPNEEMETLEEIVARVASESGASEKVIGQAYKAAIAATSTTIPVYEVDGTTVIGEFVIE